jgi:glutathione S-transferase
MCRFYCNLADDIKRSGSSSSSSSSSKREPSSSTDLNSRSGNTPSFVLTESTAINTHLGQGTQLVPSDKHQRAHYDTMLCYSMSKVDAPLWLLAKHTGRLSSHFGKISVGPCRSKELAGAHATLLQGLNPYRLRFGPHITVVGIFIMPLFGVELPTALDDPLVNYLLVCRERPAYQRAQAHRQNSSSSASSKPSWRIRRRQPTCNPCKAIRSRRDALSKWSIPCTDPRSVNITIAITLFLVILLDHHCNCKASAIQATLTSQRRRRRSKRASDSVHQLERRISSAKRFGYTAQVEIDMEFNLWSLLLAYGPPMPHIQALLVCVVASCSWQTEIVVSVRVRHDNCVVRTTWQHYRQTAVTRRQLISPYLLTVLAVETARVPSSCKSDKVFD